MKEEVRLILQTQSVPRGLLSPARPAEPSVAVVYSTGFGEVACFDGKPLRKGQQIGSKYRYRYDVDMSDHRRTARMERTPLPSRDDTFHFGAEVDVGFRASDPETIVRRNVGDALPIVYGFLSAQFRQVTRNYDIRQAEQAEQEINTRFTQPVELPEGITIYYCRVRLSPDKAARAHLQSLEDVERAKTLGAARHDLDVGASHHEHIMALIKEQSRQELDQLNAREIAQAEHQVRLAGITADARRAEERREREALAELPQNLWGLLVTHLQKHPDETAYVTELYSRHVTAVEARQDENDRRSVELVRYMIDRELLQPVDIAPLRDQALGRVQQIAAPSHGALTAGDGWDDQLPDGVSQVIHGTSIPAPPPGSPPATGHVVPVYVVVDESVAVPGYLDTVNAGLAGVPTTLAQDPDTADAIRLALLGFADDPALRIPVTPVTAGGLVPTLVPRAGCRLAPVLDDLRQRLTADIDRFKARDLVVSRPVVVVLCAAPPEDPDEWPAAHHRLTDRASFRYAPSIVACGVGHADPAVIACLATGPGQAFVTASGAPAEPSCRSFTDFVARFVAHWARQALTGAGRAAIDHPTGFVPAVAPPPNLFR